MPKEIGDMQDYVYMQWLMLQQEKPEDFVIATGTMITVRRFIELCANKLGWNKNSQKGIIWEGSGLDEVGRRADTTKK